MPAAAFQAAWWGRRFRLPNPRVELLLRYAGIRVVERLSLDSEKVRKALQALDFKVRLRLT